MSEIVPRWEWRTFGDDFGEADAKLGALERDRVQDSDEIYLVSVHSDASVKVREGLMDVKTLQEVTADGLEQWKPVLKAPFSLSAEEIGVVLGALGIDDVRAVPVSKHREHVIVDGCLAELSTITTEAGSQRTIVFESADPELVIATVRSLGLEGRENTCLAKGLKAMIGLQ